MVAWMIPAAIAGGAALTAGASLAGSALSSSAAKKASKKMAQYQKDFAQYGIRWRVADAKAAGIHPLAALGANTYQFQPYSVGDTSMGRGVAEAGEALGRGLTQMGQYYASKTMQEQELESRQLDLEYKHLRNDQLLMENMGQAMGGPMQFSALNRRGIMGQGVDVQPDQVIATRPGAPGMTAGIHAGEMFAEFPHPKHGSVLIPTLTQQLTESMEDNLMFKAPYYGISIERYYELLMSRGSGSRSERHRNFINFWERYLPKAAKGFKWDYSKLGYFYQVRSGYHRKSVPERLYDIYRPDPTVSPFIGP